MGLVEPEGIMASTLILLLTSGGKYSLLCVLVTDLVVCGILYVAPDVRQHGVAMCWRTRPGKEGLHAGQHAWE